MPVVVIDVQIEPLAELLKGDAGPIAVVEEFVLQPPEETFASGVIRRASLLGHGADDSILVAKGYPSRPPVVATAIAVKHGMLMVIDRFGRFDQCGVGEVGI